MLSRADNQTCRIKLHVCSTLMTVNCNKPQLLLISRALDTLAEFTITCVSDGDRAAEHLSVLNTLPILITGGCGTDLVTPNFPIGNYEITTHMQLLLLFRIWFLVTNPNPYIIYF